MSLVRTRPVGFVEDGTATEVTVIRKAVYIRYFAAVSFSNVADMYREEYMCPLV